MTALIAVVAVAGFVGIIIGYAITPKITNARMYQAYCKGKLSERQHREKELFTMQRRIWRLEAVVRRVENNENTSSKSSELGSNVGDPKHIKLAK